MAGSFSPQANIITGQPFEGCSDRPNFALSSGELPIGNGLVLYQEGDGVPWKLTKKEFSLWTMRLAFAAS